MTGAADATPLNRAFDAFLYAPIGEEDNGMMLTVVSALARQNVDPWALALHLDRLPGEAATHEMAAMIAQISAAFAVPPAPEAIAARLVALLPRRISRQRVEPAVTRSGGVDMRRRWLPIIVGYVLIILASQWVLAGIHKHSSPHTAPKIIAR